METIIEGEKTGADSLRIIYLVTGRFPSDKANGYQIATMCREFSKAGATVAVWRTYRASAEAIDPYEYYAVPRSAFSVCTLGGIDWMSIQWMPIVVRFYAQQLHFALAFLFSQVPRGSVVYTREPWLVWLAWVKRLPVFFECHDWFRSLIRPQVWLARRASGIVVTNRFIGSEFQKCGVSDDDILIAPNGVDLSRFDLDLSKQQAIKKLPLSDEYKHSLSDRFILMYTGSYFTNGEEKGIDDILKALRKLGEPPVFFVAVGGKEQEISHYRERAKELDVAERVMFLGRYTQDELAIFQKAADVLVMPFPDRAHYREHMSPLKTFEYMASERPIIASKLPSLRAILKDEEAFWCEPDDPDSLSQKIVELLRDTSKAQERSRNARTAVKNYTWQNRARTIIEHIQTHVSVS